MKFYKSNIINLTFLKQNKTFKYQVKNSFMLKFTLIILIIDNNLIPWLKNFRNS